MKSKTANNTKEADSLQAVDGRACGTENVEERTRWVVEWWSTALKQWHSTEGNESRTSAALRLANFHEHTPDIRMRLVEVVERRTVIKSHEPSSPIEKLTA